MLPVFIIKILEKIVEKKKRNGLAYIKIVYICHMEKSKV
jgi:hypothetical protein